MDIKLLNSQSHFCYTDGTLRASSKTLLKNAYKIYEPEHYLLRETINMTKELATLPEAQLTYEGHS